MNYKKLAELAHVSISTVSKAFSGSNEINAETRNEIFNIAREHGCFDKYYKNKFTKKVIAVLCPEFCSSHYSAYAENVQKIISGRNDVAVFSSTNFDKSLEAYLLDYYATYAKVDGVLLIDSQNQKTTNYSIPTITIGRSSSASLYLPHDFAIGEIKSYLRQFGHEDICFIGEKLTQLKENAVVKAFPNTAVIHSEKRFEEAGYDCAKQFLLMKKMPTAVIAAYDDIAIGFINALKKSGLSVPDDVSVIGMDNIPQAKYLDVPLTTVDYGISESTASALDILYRKIEHPTLNIRDTVSFTPRLVKRNTVTYPKGKQQ